MKKVIFLLVLVYLGGCVPRKGPEEKVAKVEISDSVRAIIAPSIRKIMRKIPRSTKFKISDWVCLDGKYTGVVSEIRLADVPEDHDDVIVYTVVDMYDTRNNEQVESGEYYDTQLEAGKCK